MRTSKDSGFLGWRHPAILLFSLEEALSPAIHANGEELDNIHH
jgi:hypothetical protein